LVSHGVRGGSRIVVRLIIVDVEALESSQGFVSSSRKNSRALGAAALRSLPIGKIELARTSVGNGRACATVGDKSVATIVQSSLSSLGAEALLGLCA
jgi:hypothetical protein